MKQRIIRVMGLTITSMFAIALMSCSNDLFIEFNNEDSLYEYGIKSQSLKGHQTFLDFDYNGLICNASPDIKAIFDEAYSRFTIIKTNGRLKIAQKSGKEVLVSERLYNRIERMVNAANRVFYDSNDRVNKVNRVKNRNREAVVAPDQGKCFCYAMCYAKYGDIRPEHLAWIDYKLTAKYGQDYAEGLVPNDIPEASQACDFSLSSVNSLPANTNIRAIWCKSTTVSGDTLIGHAYIITELQKSLFHCKMMFYDPEHNDEFGPYVVTPYGTSLPVTINSGDNSVVSIVYN